MQGHLLTLEAKLAAAQDEMNGNGDNELSASLARMEELQKRQGANMERERDRHQEAEDALRRDVAAQAAAASASQGLLEEVRELLRERDDEVRVVRERMLAAKVQVEALVNYLDGWEVERRTLSATVIDQRDSVDELRARIRALVPALDISQSWSAQVAHVNDAYRHALLENYARLTEALGGGAAASALKACEGARTWSAPGHSRSAAALAAAPPALGGKYLPKVDPRPMTTGAGDGAHRSRDAAAALNGRFRGRPGERLLRPLAEGEPSTRCLASAAGGAASSPHWTKVVPRRAWGGPHRARVGPA